MQLQLGSSKVAQISGRTDSLLRRYALSDLYEKDPTTCLISLQTLLETEEDGELVYAISELAYILGKRAEHNEREAEALDM
jgi:hypothetical protein